MNLYAVLPLLFLKFYFIDGPLGLVSYFGSLNHAFLQLFSLPLLLRTFFKPWKNEYREKFVGVSIGIGMVIKTFVIIADLVMLMILLASELLCILAFIAWPIATIGLLFLKI